MRDVPKIGCSGGENDEIIAALSGAPLLPRSSVFKGCIDGGIYIFTSVPSMSSISYGVYA